MLSSLKTDIYWQHLLSSSLSSDILCVEGCSAFYYIVIPPLGGAKVGALSLQFYIDWLQRGSLLQCGLNSVFSHFLNWNTEAFFLEKNHNKYGHDSVTITILIILLKFVIDKQHNKYFPLNYGKNIIWNSFGHWSFVLIISDTVTTLVIDSALL